MNVKANEAERRDRAIRIGNEGSPGSRPRASCPASARDHSPIVSRYTDLVRDDTRAMTHPSRARAGMPGKCRRFLRLPLSRMAPCGNPCNVQVGTFH
jgi:hypothetical protein